MERTARTSAIDRGNPGKHEAIRSRTGVAVGRSLRGDSAETRPARMKYGIIVTARANHELLEDAIWWAEHRDADQANRWLDGFQVALRALSQTADKQPMAKEYGELPGELRQMLYGLGRKPTHRAVFE